MSSSKGLPAHRQFARDLALWTNQVTAGCAVGLVGGSNLRFLLQQHRAANDVRGEELAVGIRVAGADDEDKWPLYFLSQFRHHVPAEAAGGICTAVGNTQNPPASEYNPLVIDPAASFWPMVPLRAYWPLVAVPPPLAILNQWML